MIDEADRDQVLAYLSNELDESATTELEARLAVDHELADLLLTLAQDDVSIRQWAKRRQREAVTREIPVTGEPARQQPQRAGRSTRTRSESGDSQSWVALVLGLFLLGPPGAISMSAVQFADYGLALPGWVDSVNSSMYHTIGFLIPAMIVAWLGGRRLVWVTHPRLAGLGSIATTCLAVTIGQLVVSDHAENEILRREQLIQSNTWITYDSAFYWPADLQQVTGHPPQEPTETQILKELKVLRAAGFTGLVLHECRPGMAAVPRLARDAGFRAVIQGIRVVDPQDFNDAATRQQVRAALAARQFVDAYFLGEFSARNVDLRALKRQLAEIRWAASRPVTTSFVHDDYLGKRGDRLRALEDFSIRAVARPWTGNSGDPDQAVSAVADALHTLHDDDKPTLLTTVFYPSGGGRGFTPDNQRRFFAEVQKLRIPRGVNFVMFNAFDRPWARRLSEVRADTPAFEGHTGLFDVKISGDGVAEFIPKPAVQVFQPPARGVRP